MSVRTVAYASTHGLLVPDELVNQGPIVKFGDGLEIVQLDEETQRLMYMTETIRRISGFRWSEQHFAIRYEYTLPTTEEHHELQREKANRNIDRLVQTLRIFKPGRFYIGGIIHKGDTPVFPSFSRPWPKNPFALYPLENVEEITRLVKFWSATSSRKVRERPNLQFAMRWFADSGDAGPVEDRVIKLMTAAEALSGAGTQHRKADRIAEVIGHLLSNVSDALKDRVRDAYRLRNEILHTGHIGQWRLSNGQKLAPAELDDFVLAVEADIRAALRQEILDRAGNA